MAVSQLVLGVVAAASMVVVMAAGRADASASVFVIQGDRSIGGLALGRGTVEQAAARFGNPALRRSRPPSCLVAWPGLGLTITFLDFSGKPCRDGAAVVATITNRGRWRTVLGLRVGDGVQRLRNLYPTATRHTGSLDGYRGFWLVTRRRCEIAGGGAFPGLLARIRDGRVSALVATAGVCE